MIGTAYAQAAGGAQGGGDTLMGMLPIILMFVILYFLMIRPQMKKAKEHRSMVEALAKGDEVIAVGILGRIEKVSDNYVTLERSEERRVGKEGADGWGEDEEEEV